MIAKNCWIFTLGRRNAMAGLPEQTTAFLGLLLQLQSCSLFAAYLLMILLSGFWQRATSPLGLRPLLVIHNFACCLGSMVTMLGFLHGIWSSGSLYSRQGSENLTWIFKLYWMTKILELLDTVFMVLRHKARQISFLHIYHHSSMLLLSELAYSFYPWPAVGVFLGMNSFVHILLYLYYGLTALSPDSPPQWKKQMTQIQIAQFLLGFVIAFIGYVGHNYCVYSMLYGISMTFLFSKFYYQAYIQNWQPESKPSHRGKID